MTEAEHETVAEILVGRNVVRITIDAIGIAALRSMQDENQRLRADLLAELRSELALANAYCANATSRHCEERISELDAAEAAGGKHAD